jgi:hypothetical protein
MMLGRKEPARGASQRRRTRGLVRSAALLGVVLAGACTGYIAGIALGTEAPPTYCSYGVTGLTASDVTFLQSKGWEAGLSPLGNNSGYVCEPCLTGGGVSCAASPAYPSGLPNPLVYTGNYSSVCGTCSNPGSL